MLCSLMAATATAARDFQVVLIKIQNKGGMWSSECIMARMRVALSDLSCYITMQSHCLQAVG